MSGGPLEGASELAVWVEECVRRILREAALGELGGDLNEAADETLIATGLDAGDVEIAGTAEAPALEAGPDPIAEAEPEPLPIPLPEPDLHRPEPTIEEEYDLDQDTRILEPVPAEDESRITATNSRGSG